jgi:paraquat-inducible protein A
MSEHLLVCEHCDAVHRWRALGSGEVARCSRCAKVLARHHRLGPHALLALTLAALVVLLIANTTPMMDLRMRGLHTAATLPEAIRYTWDEGERLVALVAAATAIVAPAMLIVLRLVVLLPMTLGRSARPYAWSMRVLHEAERWSMLEVVTVAAVISIVRIAALAQATPGSGMLGYGALALLIAALEQGGLKHLWAEIEP